MLKAVPSPMPLQACQQNTDYITQTVKCTHTHNVHEIRFSLTVLIFDFVNKGDINKIISALKIRTLALCTDPQQFLRTGDTCWLLSA
jgi:hypothetical protein